MNRSVALVSLVAGIVGLGGTPGWTAPAKHPAICGPVKKAATRFSITCAAPDNSRLSVVLSGPIATDADTGGTVFDRLVVYRGGAKLQEIAAKGEFSAGDDRLAEFVDVNFDGADDLKVMTSTSAGPNVGFDYWLFNPRTGKFEHSDIGDKLSGFDITPDPKTKTIAASGRASCCDWETVTYKWVGDALRITSIVNDGSFSLADTPPLVDANPQVCGTETKHYDDAERLTGVDYALRPKDASCADDSGAAPTLPDLLALFRQKQKGYTIAVKDQNDFTIRYDPPLPGHTSL